MDNTHTITMVGDLRPGDVVRTRGIVFEVLDIWHYGDDDEFVSLISNDAEHFGYHIAQEIEVVS